MKVEYFCRCYRNCSRYTCCPAVGVSSCPSSRKEGCGGCYLHCEVLTPPAKQQQLLTSPRPPRRPPALRSPRASQEPRGPPLSAVQPGNHLPAPITSMHALLLVRHSHPTTVDGCQPRSVIHLACGQEEKEKKEKNPAESFFF